MNIHWHLYCKPNQCKLAQQISLPSLVGDEQVTVTRLEAAVDGQLFQISFESLVELLESESGLHVEMDGAFWWTGPQAAWQMDGQVYDRGPFVQRVQLKGGFPLEAWQQLLAWLKEPSIVHDVDSGMFFDAVELSKRWK